MNKLVYLFELDSVRNTHEEIIIGQFAMFEEIARNGNRIVLSYNQVSDSKSFLSFLTNEKIFSTIMELIELGYIKVSRFKEYRTVSHYVQDIIERSSTTKKSHYIFSSLPSRYSNASFLTLIHDALRYCDYSRLSTMIETANTQDDLEFLKYMKRYIQMLLILSSNEAVNHPTQKKDMEDKSDLISFIHRIFEREIILENNTFTIKWNDETSEAYLKGIEVLKDIEKTYLTSHKATPKQVILNHRSFWIQKLSKHKVSLDVFIAQAIVDLCYNYSVEASISNVSKHYCEDNSLKFFNDFDFRLKKYIGQYVKQVHRFYTDQPMVDQQMKLKFPPLKTAARLVRHSPNHVTNLSLTQNIYESNYKKESFLWKFQIVKNMGLNMASILMYISIFVFNNVWISAIEKEVNLLSSAFQMSPLVYTVLRIISFGVLSVTISKGLKLPDILESLKNLLNWINDWFILFRVGKGYSHNNLKQGATHVI